MAQERTRIYVAVAAAVLAIGIGGYAGLRARPQPPRPVPARLDPDGGGEIADWCPAGYEPIAGGCFAGTSTRPPKGLLVYLHGRHAPEQVPEENERRSRVAELGTKRGYAVLALRGAQGECLDPRLATWWCWPSSERNIDDGPPFAARAKAAIEVATARAGATGPLRRVLLGFSNGGYFASMIARSELVSFDAIAIAHAGPVEPMRPTGSQPPILLVDADDDPSGPEMDRLEASLAKESWPHAMVAREGGHQLPAWDIEMALAFFDRVATERLPLSPPLSARARKLHPPPDSDAGDPEGPTSTSGGSSTASGATAAGSASASATDTAPPSDPSVTPTASATPTATPTASAEAPAPAASPDPVPAPEAPAPSPPE